MSPISRGFTGRQQSDADPSRVPPGQYVTHDWPVLSAGPTPHTPLDEWSFLISGAVEEPVSWTWEEFLALPAESLSVDIHCVSSFDHLVTQ
jgi:DMSO/TMAO reductase YedYZ molybdopterin-dependent catalytic subunit